MIHSVVRGLVVLLLAATTLMSAVPSTTISGIDISDDTGSSDTDFITKTETQTITATLSADLVSGETLYGSVDDGTNWSDITSKASGTNISWDGATLSGSSAIKFKVTNTDGDGEIESQTYTLDTTADDATVALNSDTGSSPTDNITNDLRVNVSDLEKTSTWEYTLDGGTNWSNGNGNSFNLGANNTYADGDVKIRTTDIAGNLSSEVSLGAVTTDTTVPTAPTVALAEDTGKKNDDNITNNDALTITDNESGATIQYTLNNGST